MQLILNEYTNPSSILNCYSRYARIKVSPERQSLTYVEVNDYFLPSLLLGTKNQRTDSSFNSFHNKYKKTVAGKLHIKFHNIVVYSLRGFLTMNVTTSTHL